MRRALGILVTGLLLAAQPGCGGGNDNGYSKPSKSSLPPTTPQGATVVTMKDIQFVPSNIKVKVGQKIVWTNDDSIAHTVTARKGASFDSGTVNGGGTFTYTPKKAGTIFYVCTIHPNQTGTITVTK